MSVRVIEAVFGSKEKETRGSSARGNARLLMLALADCADDDGRCYPGTAELCRKTGASRSAVIEARKSLVDSGELIIEKSGGSSEKRLAHRYRINLPLLVQKNDQSENATGPDSEHDQSGFRTRTGPDSGPQPSLEPSKNRHRASREKIRSMPTCDELRDFVSIELHLPASDGEHLFHHWTENGFTRRAGSKDVPIRDWKTSARKWKSGGWFPSQKNAGRPQTDALGRRLKSDGQEARRLMAQNFDIEASYRHPEEKL